MTLRIIFLALVALQALLVILDRTGVPLPLPQKVISGVRIAVALQVLAVIAVWTVRERRSASTAAEPPADLPRG